MTANTDTKQERSWRVEVRLDDRARLLGTALAATDWPERERKQGLARAHIVAEHARAWLAPYRDHACIAALQALLDKDVPLSGLYAYVMGLTPELSMVEKGTGLLRQPVQALDGGELARQLACFRDDARLPEFWKSTENYWEHAAADAARVLGDARVSEFLALCFDERRWPVFVPNLLYPGLTPFGIAAHGEAICICPPPKAVGESKPWNYGDDPEWTQQVAFRECCRATLWGLPWSGFVEADTIDLLATAATVIFLRESNDELGARAYMLMEIKRYGHSSLPNAVEALSAYVHSRQAHALHVMEGLHAALEKSVG